MPVSAIATAAPVTTPSTRVQRGGGQAVVGDDRDLDAARASSGQVEAGRHDDPAGAALRQRRADRGGEAASVHVRRTVAR